MKWYGQQPLDFSFHSRNYDRACGRAIRSGMAIGATVLLGAWGYELNLEKLTIYAGAGTQKYGISSCTAFAMDIILAGWPLAKTILRHCYA